MPEYRRVYIPGGTYFFTLVTYERRRIFTSREAIQLLHTSISKVLLNLPFTINAYAVLPDHMHFLWTLPENDSNYSVRIAQMKRYFSKEFKTSHFLINNMPTSRVKRAELPIWQRRFWEHSIQDEKDFNQHLDYIHYNPVKHGLVEFAKDWSASSFMDYVRTDNYDLLWGQGELKFSAKSFGE